MWRENFTPYGEKRVNPSQNEDSISYTGHVSNSSGLVYMQARYYDPVIGRFYSNDPVGYTNIHTFNRYSYANNNPYRYTDPNGESALEIGELLVDAGNLIGASVAYAEGVITGDSALTSIAGAGVVAHATNTAISAAGVASPVPGTGKAIKAAVKLSKVAKVKKPPTVNIGDGKKFTKKTKVFPGNGPGQSRAEIEIVKNSEGKVIRTRKFSYDRANKFQHKKRTRGGPDGRKQDEDQ